ncbi:MAG: flagellar basal body P-ring formation protein FlgA [Sulfuriflexus sp.]|nr:flagellar basal body P-ring formation protein FlgA [Sulfuriflexus sp.]
MRQVFKLGSTDHCFSKTAFRQGLAVVLCLLAGMAQAVQYHDLQDIRQSSENYLRAQLGVDSNDTADITITAASMDYRLRLAQCDTPIEHSLPQGHRLQGRVAVGTRCTDELHRWSVFVPVTITQFAEVIVTTETVSRGEFLKASQLKLERRSLNFLHNGYLKSMKQAIGQKLKTTLAKGLVVSPSQLKRPYDVKKGQNVNILAKSDQISVRIKGKALSNARIGDRIRVKNTSTNKIIEGTVTYDGFVEIKL